MESWVKDGFDVMLKSFAEHFAGSLTYVKHPTNGAVHTYYINLQEKTVVLCLTEIDAEVYPADGTAMN